MFIAAINLLVLMFATQLVSPQPITSAEQLYSDVKAYDYSKGHNDSIEKKIKQYTAETVFNADNQDEYVTAMRAKAEYYYGLGKYYTAAYTLQELEKYIINQDDLLYVIQNLAQVYRTMGSDILAQKYQDEYDALTKKCGEDTP